MAVEVRTYAGVPPVAAFASASGTPIVIDNTANVPYYLAPGDIVTAIGGGGGSGTVTHTGALTANAVVVGNGAADEKVLASLGTSGQVLTSNGAGVPPSFQTQTSAAAGVVTLTYAATILVDASLGNDFRVTLTGDAILGNPTNLTNGQKLTFRVFQDSTGLHRLTFDTKYWFPPPASLHSMPTTGGQLSPAGRIAQYGGAETFITAEYDTTDLTLACQMATDLRPGASPLTLTGITGWWDFTDAAYLYTDTAESNAVVADGDTIAYAKSKTSLLGTRAVILQVTAGNRPSYKKNIVNGCSVVRLNGTTQQSVMQQYNSLLGSVAAMLQNGGIWSPSAKTLIVAVSITGGNADTGNPYGNNIIIGDIATNRFGLSFFKATASTATVQAYNFNGATFNKPGQTINFPGFFICSAVHDGVNLKMRINAGAWNTTASGPTNTPTGGAGFGSNNAAAGTFGNFDCTAVVTANAVASDADIYLVERYLGWQVGLAL